MPACTVEIVMIMIELTRDEGHRDYMSDGTGDNDDVLSAFFHVPSPWVMKAFHHPLMIPVITPGRTDNFLQCNRDCNLESEVQPKRLLIKAPWIVPYGNKI